MKKYVVFICMVSFFYGNQIKAQESKINWLTFEQLQDSLAVKKKKVFISFHADWCAFCKKMEKTAYQNKVVISILNKHFYAVSMNAEYKDTIVFDGISYSNKNIGKSRRPTHEIALLFGSRKNKPFSLPVNLILDENFKITKRYHEYLSPKDLIAILKAHI